MKIIAIVDIDDNPARVEIREDDIVEMIKSKVLDKYPDAYVKVKSFNVDTTVRL